MIRNRLGRTIVAISAMVTTTNAFTIGTNNFEDEGRYFIGQGGVGSIELGFLHNLFGGMEIKDKTGFAGRIGIGYQMNRYLALESTLAVYPSAIRHFDSSRELFGFQKIVGDSKISNIYSAVHGSDPKKEIISQG